MLNVVYMHPVKWIQMYVVGGLVSQNETELHFTDKYKKLSDLTYVKFYIWHVSSHLKSGSTPVNKVWVKCIRSDLLPSIHNLLLW